MVQQQQDAYVVSQLSMILFPSTIHYRAFFFSEIKALGGWAIRPLAASTSGFILITDEKFLSDRAGHF